LFEGIRKRWAEARADAVRKEVEDIRLKRLYPDLTDAELDFFL
jgi:hypothetical protein